MRHRVNEILSLATLVAACAWGCAPVAGPQPASQPIAQRPSIDVPRAVDVPRIDASSDDPAWQHAAEIAALVAPIGKSVDASALLPTRVSLLWDDQALYLRFVATDPAIYLPFEGDQRDREYYRGDVAEVFLDVVGDGKQVLELQVTPANQVFDQQLLVTADRVEYNENGRIVQSILDRDFWKDLNYDMPGLKTAAARTADGSGWVVDIAIPAAAAMRRVGVKSFDAGRTLRANFIRYDWQLPPGAPADAKRVLVPQNWSPVEFGRPHQSPGAMGWLRLVDRQR